MHLISLTPWLIDIIQWLSWVIVLVILLQLFVNLSHFCLIQQSNNAKNAMLKKILLACVSRI